MDFELFPDLQPAIPSLFASAYNVRAPEIGVLFTTWGRIHSVLFIN